MVIHQLNRGSVLPKCNSLPGIQSTSIPEGKRSLPIDVATITLELEADIFRGGYSENGASNLGLETAEETGNVQAEHRGKHRSIETNLQTGKWKKYTRLVRVINRSK
jgi:hypothetical protein